MGGVVAPWAIHAPKERQLCAVAVGTATAPDSIHSGAAVGGHGLLGGALVVPAAPATDGAVQTPRALPRVLVLALACPHPQAYGETKTKAQKYQHCKPTCITGFLLDVTLHARLFLSYSFQYGTFMHMVSFLL